MVLFLENFFINLATIYLFPFPALLPPFQLAGAGGVGVGGTTHNSENTCVNKIYECEWVPEVNNLPSSIITVGCPEQPPQALNRGCGEEISAATTI